MKYKKSLIYKLVFFLLWTKDWWCEGRIEQVKVQKPHSYLMKISMSNYGTGNRTLACITNLQSNYSLTQTHNIALNGLLFWSQLTEPCWHLLQFTITELYLGIFYNSDHTNKTLHWHVFCNSGATLKELEESDVTLKEPYIAMFQSSEVTLTCLHVKQFWSVIYSIIH